MKIKIAITTILSALLLTSCAGVDLGPDFRDQTLTFRLKDGDALEVYMRGCATQGGNYINNSDKMKSHISSTMISYDEKTNSTLDEFLVQCSPASPKGRSGCSVRHVRGPGKIMDCVGVGHRLASYYAF